MIVHHTAAAALNPAELTIGGARGPGPASMGLWTCIEPAQWQRS